MGFVLPTCSAEGAPLPCCGCFWLLQCDVIIAEDYSAGTAGLAKYLDFLNR
jgi:hypothetical protein